MLVPAQKIADAGAKHAGAFAVNDVDLAEARQGTIRRGSGPPPASLPPAFAPRRSSSVRTFSSRVRFRLAASFGCWSSPSRARFTSSRSPRATFIFRMPSCTSASVAAQLHDVALLAEAIHHHFVAGLDFLRLRGLGLALRRLRALVRRRLVQPAARFGQLMFLDRRAPSSSASLRRSAMIVFRFAARLQHRPRALPPAPSRAASRAVPRTAAAPLRGALAASSNLLARALRRSGAPLLGADAGSPPSEAIIVSTRRSSSLTSPRGVLDDRSAAGRAARRWRTRCFGPARRPAADRSG